MGANTLSSSIVDIQTEQPLAITVGMDACLTQHPFDQSADNKALVNNGSYLAGMNLRWIDLQWSPAPGVPLRASAIEQMSKTCSEHQLQSVICTLQCQVQTSSPSCTKQLSCGSRPKKSQRPLSWRSHGTSKTMHAILSYAIGGSMH